VLYVAGEGIGGLKLRVAAWKLHHGITESIGGFRVVPLAVNLMDKAEAAQLIATVAGAKGFDPKLAIVDTLARAMPGGDENSAKDIGVPIRSAGVIQASLGCAVMLIHHAGKDAERGLRGSTGLPGAADTVLRLKREGANVTLEVEKQKDHDGGQILRLRSKVVELSLIPGSLKPRSSLVLVSGGSDAAAKSGEALSHLERTARRFPADLVGAEGTPLPQSGEGVRGVSAIRWREECESRGLSTAETRKSRGTVFRRTFQSLLDKNAVAVRDGIVWLINQEA
jgi:hypothetical protein